MPTAAKIIGALLLALTAGYSTYLFFGLNDLLNITIENLAINILIGFVVGWRSIGSDPGFGGATSLLAGIRGGVLFVVLTSAVFGLWVVYKKLESFFIKDIGGVFTSWVDASFNYLTVFLDPYVLLVVVVGGVVSGLASGLANRFWT